VALLIGACSYGPPRLELRITNHSFAPTGPIAALAVYAAWLRPPTGLSTFPDGGRPQLLAEAAAVYSCDTLSLAVRRVWRVDRPETIRSGFTPWLGPWLREGLYVSLRGYSTMTTEASSFRRLNYRLDSSGHAEPVVREPGGGAATSDPRRCAAQILAAARADPPARRPR
jgi:hypothetical protein